MGVNITFTFDHNLTSISMAEVLRRCGVMNEMFEEVAAHWAQWYPGLSLPLCPWRDAGAADDGWPFYMAPAGFSFAFGTAAVRLHHFCRFRIFTQDEAERTLLRRFVRRCGQLLGGDRAICAPEDGIGEDLFGWVREGRSVAKIESELLLQAPPARTIEELDIRHRPPWDLPAYYVDTFQDIS